jgi:hypothetical protein
LRWDCRDADHRTAIACEAPTSCAPRASDAGAAGRQQRMTPDKDERSLQQTEAEMAAEADRMQDDLDELGEHADEAAKKAQVTREQADLDANEPLGDVAGDWEDMARSDDDPVGAVDEPQDAER